MELNFRDYRLTVEPRLGGSLLAFDWCGMPLMRRASGSTILDVACFPMLPFCNRIAQGCFTWRGREEKLPPNLPDTDRQHPLHGYGWLSGWSVLQQNEAHISLEHHHDAGDWPWRYRAMIDYSLSVDGLCIALSLTNVSDEAMPAGLGFHPYFPRNGQTRYHGHHRGEWQNDEQCLSLRLEERPDAADWWLGAPVDTRPLDTVYSGRDGQLRIEWPDRNLALLIKPCDGLPHTGVYVPPESDWFCIEPMSHSTNAINHPQQSSGMMTLLPGNTFSVSAAFSAEPVLAG